MSTGSSVEVAPSSTIAVLQDKSKDCPTGDKSNNEPRRPRKGHKKSRRVDFTITRDLK